jgi:hypothetical protein
MHVCVYACLPRRKYTKYVYIHRRTFTHNKDTYTAHTFIFPQHVRRHTVELRDDTPHLKAVGDQRLCAVLCGTHGGGRLLKLRRAYSSEGRIDGRERRDVRLCLCACVRLCVCVCVCMYV